MGDSGNVRRFYNRAFSSSGYAEYATPERHFAHQEVANFVECYELRSKRCLEIGCGRGLLQDLVNDYTGVDISESVRPYLRKPFLCCDAAQLPFDDYSFDAGWTITVLEHVPDPEAALSEMRRVLKPGALLFLKPGWHCRPWICEGIPVRPYSELTARQRWIKATLFLRNARALRAVRMLLRRMIRVMLDWKRQGPVPLYFERLHPDYETFWMADSDAAVSLDPFDVILWFRQRGDLVISHPTLLAALASRNEALVIQITHAA